MKVKMILFVMIVILIFWVGCEKKKEIPKEVITERGEIFYDNTPDGCGAVYMFRTMQADEILNKWYKPENLPKKFEVDNMEVMVTYSLTDKTHNCGFGGKSPIIIIHKITKLKE